MALYEYNLHVVREARKPDMAGDLGRTGLAAFSSRDNVSILDGVNASYSEFPYLVDSACPLQIASLIINESGLEKILSDEPAVFLTWLWRLFEVLDVAYAFMDGGFSSGYYEFLGLSISDVFGQLGDLVCGHKVEFLHPLMFLSARVGTREFARRARQVSHFFVDERQSGCLAILISGDMDRGQVEILDPGTMYSTFRDLLVGPL